MLTGTTSFYSGEFLFQDSRTWYRITPPRPGLGERLPVVTLHGGPGAGHDYLLPYTALSNSGHAVVHYDQIGCARSTHYPRRGKDFFTVELFLEQLQAVIRHLGIERYHLLGHSWGGMLAVEHALQKPKGLVSLIIADSAASIPLWESEARRLWEGLDPVSCQAFKMADASGNVDTPELKAAVKAYYRKHVGLFDPEPTDLHNSTIESEADGHTYAIMWGPNECMVSGSLHNWDATDRLAQISVPTLVIAGENDQVTPQSTKPFRENIKDIREVRVPNASHVPHIENPEITFTEINRFIDYSESL